MKELYKGRINTEELIRVWPESRGESSKRVFLSTRRMKIFGTFGKGDAFLQPASRDIGATRCRTILADDLGVDALVPIGDVRIAVLHARCGFDSIQRIGFALHRQFRLGGGVQDDGGRNIAVAIHRLRRHRRVAVFASRRAPRNKEREQQEREEGFITHIILSSAASVPVRL